jgi:hypothetical protein
VSRTSVYACGVALLLGFPTPALAAAPALRGANRRVELVVARPHEAGELPRFEQALRGALTARQLELGSTRKDTLSPEDVVLAITASPDEAGPVVARVFIDFVAPGHATLFLIDPRRGRIHVRRVMLDHGFDAVARESALFVIEQSLDAILEGREIGVSREEYQRSVAPPPTVTSATPSPSVAAPPIVAAPERPARDTRLVLAGGYEGVALGPAALQHAGRLALNARSDRFQVGVAARLAAPITIGADGVEAKLWAGGVDISGAARLLGSHAFSVSAALGVGLDLTHVDPRVTAPDLQATTGFWAPSPRFRTALELERLFGDISVVLAFGAEAHLLAERYTVRTGNEARDVFVPRGLRPTVALLVGVAF